MIYEVRCCCKPEKLLGHVDTEVLVGHGVRLVFLLAPLSATDIGRPETLHTEVAQINIPTFGGDYHGYLAIKSNDYPIETWRRVAGFKEAK